MIPWRTPEEVMRESIAQMAQVMTGMTQVMAQLANVNAAREAAATERQAAENERQAQRLAREEAMRNTRGNRTASGGPVRPAHQNKGKQVPKKPYHGIGRGKAPMASRPQTGTPGDNDVPRDIVCFKCGSRGISPSSVGLISCVSIATNQGTLPETVGRQELSRQQLWQGEAVQSLRVGYTP